MLQPFLDINGLDSDYTYSGLQMNGKDIGEFVFETSNVGSTNQVRFIAIEGLGHGYTNILIDPLWDFLVGESMP